jgi:hypothetical protein
MRENDELLKSGAPGEIRTPDPLLRRQTLYPTELRARCYADSKSIIRDNDTILEGLSLWPGYSCPYIELFATNE